MRKVFGLVILFLLLIGLIGCQTADDSADTAGEELSFGTVAGNVYKSDFIRIGCTLDEDWAFYNDTQIRELNNIVTDLAGEEYEALMKEADIVYDMYAADSSQLDNINITLEKVDTVQLLALDIAENFKRIADYQMSTLETMGYENTGYEIAEVEIDGKTLDALYTTGEINGISMYQVCFQKKCRGYLASIAITAFFENTIPDLLENFFWTE